MTTIIDFIIVFVILVLVHEFGHYWFAKRSGILVREFSIGMGPKLVAWHKNNTTYTLRLLPLGGYVRMAGWQDEDDEIKPGTMLAIEVNGDGRVTRINTSNKTTLQGGIPVQVSRIDLVHELVVEGYANGDESELKTWPVDHDATIIEEDGTEVVIAPDDVQFQNAPIAKRLLVNFAGPMNNFILAILVFIGVALSAGVQVLDTNQIGTVQSGSPAAKAGLENGATITSIDGQAISQFADLQKVVGEDKDGPSLNVVAKQNGKTENLTITPTKEGLIGVTPPVDRSIGTAIKYGFTQFWSLTTRIFDVLKQLVTGQFSLNKLAGPVGIYTMTSQAASGGFQSLLFFLGYLSLNLGIMNLIPIPVLDGGKILLNLLEIIRRKPLSPEKEGIVTLIGAGLMVLLLIAVTINDIMRQF
ncbi:RIP metalloprotease RseP [Lacticaseibacillus mingshuiensis]|uniref:RIP metalloprotease RseP n=1 Tax=Lacticaseibacillus mingshuiensis TaxID=2799574 RepID=UPI001951C671|nr:RIP metalloprotease RseP [Lacticaseibacillus mingshuiensis]